MTSCGFLLAHYRETLLRAVELGYSCMSMRDFAEKKFPNSEKILLLRHDVDFELDLDLRLTEIERELNCTSTLFVRLHAKDTNTLSYPNAQKLRKLHDNGFEIGLHFEPQYQELLGVTGAEALQRERESLQNGLGLKITSVAPHEPVRSGTLELPASEMKHAGLTIQAYDKSLLAEFKYLSDSACRWREGCFCEWLGKADKLYVLTHGIWWHEKTPLETY